MKQDAAQGADLTRKAEKTSTTRGFRDWLIENGGQLDRVDGPAVIVTRADESSPQRNSFIVIPVSAPYCLQG